ncbi:hypothetical protein [Actinomadura atramentaria]|uniref:hypothetical protein n=1 Tax=Actinomadura atramentaria TaxID=1990 RepID=UPI0012FB2C5B|nr:hypothetical protein [Actinomadura atramentaria]
MAAALVDVTGPDALLRDLCRAGLVECDADGYRARDAVREHGRSLMNRAEFDAALRRLIVWYLYRAAEADYTLMPGRWRDGPAYERLRGHPPEPNAGAAIRWLEGHRAELRAAVEAAAERRWADLVVQHAEAQWALCFQLKHYEHWLAIHRHAIVAAPDASDRRLAARAHCQYGLGLLELGDFDGVTVEFAADRTAGDARATATDVEFKGLVLLRRSGAENLPDLTATRPDLAVKALGLFTDNLRLNLAMSEDAKDPRAVALAWRHRGRALSATSAHDDAVRHLCYARDRFADLGDHYNEGKTLTDFGQALLRAGRIADAAEPLRAALGLLPADRHAAERATVLETLSARAARAEDRSATVVALIEARELLRPLGGPRADAVAARLAELKVQE